MANFTCYGYHSVNTNGVGSNEMVDSLLTCSKLIFIKEKYGIFFQISLMFGPNHGSNKWVSQMWAPLAACREPAGIQNRPLNMLYVFEHKT